MIFKLTSVHQTWAIEDIHQTWAIEDIHQTWAIENIKESVRFCTPKFVSLDNKVTV